jgi:hypothetical protein
VIPVKTIELAAAGSPVAAVVPLANMPWYAHVVIALCGPVAYVVVRIHCQRRDERLGRQALRRVHPDQVAQVVAAITGKPSTTPPRQHNSP